MANAVHEECLVGHRPVIHRYTDGGLAVIGKHRHEHRRTNRRRQWDELGDRGPGQEHLHRRAGNIRRRDIAGRSCRSNHIKRDKTTDLTQLVGKPKRRLRSPRPHCLTDFIHQGDRVVIRGGHLEVCDRHSVLAEVIRLAQADRHVEVELIHRRPLPPVVLAESRRHGCQVGVVHGVTDRLRRIAQLRKRQLERAVVIVDTAARHDRRKLRARRLGEPH